MRMITVIQKSTNSKTVQIRLKGALDILVIPPTICSSALCSTSSGHSSWSALSVW